MPALPEPGESLAAGAPQLFPEVAGNRALTRTIREGDAAAAFGAAAHVVPLHVAQARVSAVATPSPRILPAAMLLRKPSTSTPRCGSSISSRRSTEP